MRATRTNTPIAALEAAISTAREAIAQKRNALTEMDGSIVPREVAESRIDNFVDGLAESANVEPWTFTERDFTRPRWWDWSLEDLIKLVAFAAGDEIKSRLKAQLDSEYEGQSAISSEDFKAAVAAAKSELFELEVEEERLIMQAETAGLSVVRRADADPRALLEA